MKRNALGKSVRVSVCEVDLALAEVVPPMLRYSRRQGMGGVSVRPTGPREAPTRPGVKVANSARNPFMSTSSQDAVESALNKASSPIDQCILNLPTLEHHACNFHGIHECQTGIAEIKVQATWNNLAFHAPGRRWTAR